MLELSDHEEVRDPLVRKLPKAMHAALANARDMYRAGLMRQGLYYSIRRMALAQANQKKKRGA